MGATVAWFSAAAAVAFGYWFGNGPLYVDRAQLLVLVDGAIGVAVVCALSAMLLVRSHGRHLGPMTMLLAALVLCAARGGVARGDEAATSQPWQWVTSQEGALIDVHVRGASTTSSVCEFEAQVRASSAIVLVSAPASACPLSEGQIVRLGVTGWRWHDTQRLPGVDSPLRKAWARGLHARASVTHVWRVSQPSPGPWRWIAEQRHRAWSQTRGDPAAGLVVATTLGLRDALPPAEREEVRAAGLGHLIAVSGLHVGLTAGWLHLLILRVGAWLRLSRTLALLVTLVPLVGYVAVTGAPASAVRAACMFTFAEIGSVRGRPLHGLTNLGMTSAVMLLVRPAWCVDLGFQLSLLAMAALVVPPVPHGMVQQTWRISWVLLPLLVVTFGTDNFIALLANPLVVPIFAIWVMPMGLLGWAVSPWLGPQSWSLAAWGAQWTLDVAELLAAVPTRPPFALGAALMLVLVVAWRGAPLRLPIVSGAIALACTFGFREPPPRSGTLLAGSGIGVEQLVMSADGSGCLVDPRRSPGRWRALLRGLGAAAVHRIVWLDGGSKQTEALEADLVRVLHQQGLWQPSDAGCDPLPDDRAKSWLEQCRALGGGAPLVWVEPGGEASCYTRGQWEPLFG